MLETWLSKERLLLNSTPRFLTDDEEFTEQPSSVRQCSRLLLVGVLGPIINTSVFSEFSSKKLLVIQFFYIDSESVVNKTFILNDFFTSQRLDFLFLTETWINVGDLSPFTELVPPDCDLSSPRTIGRGGGLASVFKKKFDCRSIKNDTFSSFEEQLMQIDSRNPVLCVLVYRPPKINKNFIHEFTGFLGGIMMKYDRLVILGDFNIHICCSSNGLAREFLNLIDSFNLVQSVTGPTHKLGHTLDLVLSYGLTVCDFEIMETGFSDHKSVVFNMSLSCSLGKPCVSTRRCRIMNSETSNDFCTMYEAAFSNSYYDCSSDLCADELLFSFTSVCSNILDSIAPLKTRCFKSKSEPWLNNSTRAAHRLCRRAEHKWKKDKLQVSYEIFKNRLTNYQKTIKMARVKYFSGLIE